MNRFAEGLFLALLAIGLVEAGLLLARERSSPRAAFALVAPESPPLSAAGADGAVRARVSAVGDYLTVEDLARGVLALERGELPGAAPLTDAERRELATRVAQADAHRQELLAIETDLRTKEAELDQIARELAASFTPEQRAWVLAERDRVSVGRIEAAYWAALVDELAEAAP